MTSPNFLQKKNAAIVAAQNHSLHPEGCQVIQREGWYQVITPTFKEVSDNQIMFSVISDSEVDTSIEKAFASYAKYNLPFKWSIGPMSSPLIEQKISGRASQVWDFKGMAIDTDAKIPGAENIEVELVTEKNFEDFLSVIIPGWKMEKFEDESREKFKRAISNPKSQHFIARKNGKAIASSGMIIKEDHGYLIGGVVLPEYRGSGIYRTLIQKRLCELKEMGLSFAVTHAMATTSAPILEKLGFETVFEAKSYRFDP